MWYRIYHIMTMSIEFIVFLISIAWRRSIDLNEKNFDVSCVQTYRYSFLKLWFPFDKDFEASSLKQIPTSWIVIRIQYWVIITGYFPSWIHRILHRTSTSKLQWLNSFTDFANFLVWFIVLTFQLSIKLVVLILKIFK